jgi:hypothetical protein
VVGVRYSGYYLRRSTAEAALRTCHRRGWEPTLRRSFGIWVVGVHIEAPEPVAVGAAQPELTRERQPAST